MYLLNYSKALQPQVNISNALLKNVYKRQHRDTKKKKYAKTIKLIKKEIPFLSFQITFHITKYKF